MSDVEGPMITCVCLKFKEFGDCDSSCMKA